jgi:phosphatidate cytidylyltransferase
MKKIFERLIVFFVGLPVLLSVVIFFPQCNHLLLNLLIVVFSVLGAVEFRNILSKKIQVVSLTETMILGAMVPAAWTLAVCFGIEDRVVHGLVIPGAAWLLVSGIFGNRDKFDSYIGRTITGFSMMIYPGFFLAFLIRMALFKEAGLVILIFILTVLLNDAFAWAAGILFGKNNRGFFAASPNKSLSGFAGGLAASLSTGMAAVLIFPGAFTSTLAPSILAGAVLGLATGTAATLGDLGESAMKRSAGVKDSGTLILGRGGALDSIDSLLLAAPVYYTLYQILFLK